MNTLTLDHECLAKSVKCDKSSLIVELKDGRELSVPLAWFPRLLNGSHKERNYYELLGEGEGVHWPDLDEDISIEGLIAGRRSGESDRSLKKWLEKRG